MNVGPWARAASALMYLFGVVSLIFGVMFLSIRLASILGAIGLVIGIGCLMIGTSISRGSATAAWVGIGLTGASLALSSVLALATPIDPNWIRVVLEVVLLIVLFQAAQELSNTG